jgi:hypothetical protein
MIPALCVNSSEIPSISKEEIVHVQHDTEATHEKPAADQLGRSAASRTDLRTHTSEQGAEQPMRDHPRPACEPLWIPQSL